MSLDFDFSFTSGGGTLTVTPIITRRSPTQSAPEVVHMTASVSGQDTDATVGANGYDATLHDIEYLWDGYFVGSANAYTFAAPTGIYAGSARHANGHRNSRYQYGAKSAFTYRTPGTYTVRLYAYEPSSGKFGSGDVTFTVGNQDDAYPGLQTVYADPSATYANAPAGCQVTTQSSLSTLISTYVYNAGSPMRILLAAGQSFTINATNFLGQGHGNPFAGLLIDRRGAGAKPTVSFASPVKFIDHDDSGTGNTNKSLIIANTDFTGTYDDATQATENTVIAEFTTSTVHAEYFLLDGSTIRNVNSGMNVSPGVESTQRYIAFNDVDMEERAFGSLRYGGTRHTFVGCRLHSTPLAAIDSSAGAGWGDRIMGRVVLYHSCDWFCRQGGNPIGSFRTPQPCIRANFDQGYSTEGDEYYFVASKFEAPGWLPCFQFIDAEGGSERPCNIIIDKTIIQGGWATDTLIEAGTGGMTVRSSLLHNPECAARLGNQILYFVRLQGTSTTALNQSAPIKIYNNTCINDLDGAKNPFGASGPVQLLINSASFTTVTPDNNIVYNTRTSPATTSDGPIARSVDEFAYNDGGYLDIGGSGDLSSTYFVNMPAGELDYPELLTGSPSIGAATIGLVHDSDFFGRRVEDVLSGLARSTPSIGAFEPALES